MLSIRTTALFVGLILCLALVFSGCGSNKPPEVTPRSCYAYVPNFDDNTISIFRQNSDGSLTEIHSPVTTGTNPVNLVATRDGKYLYVSNYNDIGMSCYRINADGSLSLLTDDLVQVNNYVGHIRLNPGGNRLYAISSSATSLVNVFDIQTNGNLQKVAASSSIPVNSNAQDIAFTPNGQYAYVCASGKTVVLYSVIDDGTLSLGLSYDTENNPVCLGITPNGQYLYALHNTSSNNLDAFEIASDGQLAHIETKTISGAYPEDFMIHPNGKYLYTANWSTDNISVFEIGMDGKLTLKNTYSTGTRPRRINIDPAYKYLYVTNRDSNNITVFVIQPDGTLVNTNTTVETGATPYRVELVSK